MPSNIALEQYNLSYFSSAHGGQPNSRIAIAFFSGIARLRIEHVNRFLVANNITVTRILECGPGTGFFARAWLEKFPQTEYLAIETDKSCHKLLQELGVKLVDGAQSRTASSIVDLVVMSHVLEHVPRPTEFIMEATLNLRDGGALFVEVPCQDYEHKATDEPHLLFFDKNPMEHLLRLAGFKNIATSYHGVPISRLQSPQRLRTLLLSIRARLIARGVIAPFRRVFPGMEVLSDPLERAAIAPFQAHCESPNPAWWLRALAIKQ